MTNRTFLVMLTVDEDQLGAYTIDIVDFLTKEPNGVLDTWVWPANTTDVDLVERTIKPLVADHDGPAGSYILEEVE